MTDEQAFGSVWAVMLSAKSQRNAVVINMYQGDDENGFKPRVEMQCSVMKTPWKFTKYISVNIIMLYFFLLQFVACTLKAWSWNKEILFLLQISRRPGCPMRPTLALMMVGLGSKMPCIFLKAGMTKRLQVTTADTGFPRTKGRTQRVAQGEKTERKISE